MSELALNLITHALQRHEKLEEIISSQT